MNREVPCDATTLIYLAKSETFEVIAASDIVLLVAPGVWREAVEAGEASGYADATAIRVKEPSRITRRTDLDAAKERLASEIATTHRLGEGESEALSLTPSGQWVLVDDGRAAKTARSLGLIPVSTLFLPAIASRRGAMAVDAAVATLRAIATAANARAETVFEVEAWIRGERT